MKMGILGTIAGVLNGGSVLSESAEGSSTTS